MNVAGCLSTEIVNAVARLIGDGAGIAQLNKAPHAAQYKQFKSYHYSYYFKYT